MEILSRIAVSFQLWANPKDMTSKKAFENRKYLYRSHFWNKNIVQLLERMRKKIMKSGMMNMIHLLWKLIIINWETQWECSSDWIFYWSNEKRRMNNLSMDFQSRSNIIQSYISEAEKQQESKNTSFADKRNNGFSNF